MNINILPSNLCDKITWPVRLDLNRDEPFGMSPFPCVIRMNEHRFVLSDLLAYNFSKNVRIPYANLPKLAITALRCVAWNNMIAHL